MVQGKITEADTLTIRLGTTPSGLVSDPPVILPPRFYTGCPSCLNPPKSIVAWDRHQNMLACIPIGLVILYNGREVVVVIKID